MKEVKLTEEELKTIEEVSQEGANIVLSLGRIELEKETLSRQANHLKSQYAGLVEKEELIKKGLREKYGEGSFNPQTGVFTPSRPVQPLFKA